MARVLSPISASRPTSYICNSGFVGRVGIGAKVQLARVIGGNVEREITRNRRHDVRLHTAAVVVSDVGRGLEARAQGDGFVGGSRILRRSGKSRDGCAADAIPLFELGPVDTSRNRTVFAEVRAEIAKARLARVHDEGRANRVACARVRRLSIKVCAPNHGPSDGCVDTLPGPCCV